MGCTTAQAWRTPPYSKPSFIGPYSLQNNNFFNKCFYIVFTELINNGDLHIEISGMFGSLKKEEEWSRVEGERVIQLPCLEVF